MSTAPIVSARSAANRSNAAKSTGPKTPAGKARSRTDAFKHGLTVAGVALSTEDAALVAAELEAAQEDFAPTTRLGAKFVRRAAILSIRLDRCEQYAQAAPCSASGTPSPATTGPEPSTPTASWMPSRPTAPAAELARRYEQATARELSRVIQGFRRVEAVAAPIVETEEPAGEVASEADHKPFSEREIGPMASFGKAVPEAAPVAVERVKPGCGPVAADEAAPQAPPAGRRDDRTGPPCRA